MHWGLSENIDIQYETELLLSGR